jgi:hypothetical protein
LSSAGLVEPRASQTAQSTSRAHSAVLPGEIEVKYKKATADGTPAIAQATLGVAESIERRTDGWPSQPRRHQERSPRGREFVDPRIRPLSSIAVVEEFLDRCEARILRR